MTRNGFVFIEILITLAIVAILAAIAVPNFAEAQTRARISRTKNELRTLSVGIESYFIDKGKTPYPIVGFIGTQRWTIGADSDGWWSAGYVSFITELTTPIPYLATVEYLDPFLTPVKKYIPTQGAAWGFRTKEFFPYSYSNFDGWWAKAADIKPDPQPHTRGYLLRSFGPDQAPQYPDYAMTSLVDGDATGNLKFTGIFGGKSQSAWAMASIYDITNGSVSTGDIVRWGGGISGPGQ